MSSAKEIRTAIILLILQTTTAKPDKSTGPAVFEVINEQARIDDKKVLPYENPLADKSLQNAKLHAQHQQAMFQAERVRQHRAQLLRWNNYHPKVDSYMKAYQESQENHHLALENSQGDSKDKKVRARPEQSKTLKDKVQVEPVKVTRSDAVNKNRNHRSFGSIHGSVHKLHKSYPYSGPSYDQGVTIKPHGNVGLYNYAKEHTTLYAKAVPTKSRYVYPKLYSQMYAYQSSNDVNTLSTLVNQPPQNQLHSLINTPKVTTPEPLNTNNDIYYYLQNSQFNHEVSPTSSAVSNTRGYPVHKDYTPITEEVDDIEDDRDHRIKFIQPLPTVLTQVDDDSMTTINNYYKLENEQTGNDASKNTEFSSRDLPQYEAFLKQETPLHFYDNEPSTEGIKYLKSQTTGVQHLSQDGTVVSAYGDDDVSIKNYRTKRELDTELFIFGNYTTDIEKPNSIQSVLNETKINLEINCTLSIQNITIADGNMFDIDRDLNETLPTPEALKRNRFIKSDNGYNIGEVYDYDYPYDDNEPNGRSKFDYSDENDYDYESNIPEYDYDIPRTRPRPKRPRLHKDQDSDNGGSFSNRYSSFKHLNFDDIHSEPSNGYFGQQFNPIQYKASNQFSHLSDSYEVPIQYNSPVIQTPSPFLNFDHASSHVPQVSGVINSLQPVYMLTQSQIKDLLSNQNQKLNIEHLDVFQLPHDTVQKPRRPRYHRQHKPKYRRFPKRGRKHKLGRFRKINKFVKFY